MSSRRQCTTDLILQTTSSAALRNLPILIGVIDIHRYHSAASLCGEGMNPVLPKTSPMSGYEPLRSEDVSPSGMDWDIAMSTWIQKTSPMSCNKRSVTKDDTDVVQSRDSEGVHVVKRPLQNHMPSSNLTTESQCHQEMKYQKRPLECEIAL